MQWWLGKNWDLVCMTEMVIEDSQVVYKPFSYSIQFTCSVVSDSLQHHESQHARPPCPSPTPGVHPNTYPLSQWCHPIISSSVVPFSSWPQSFPHSVQFSRSVVPYSLRSHESQHTRPPCPSSTPGVYSNSCPSSRWCHPAISFSAVPFSSCPQSLPATGSFPMSQLFTWGGQSIGSFSFNISPSNEHPGLISFRMDWLDLLAVQGTLKSLLQHHSSKVSIIRRSAF